MEEIEEVSYDEMEFVGEPEKEWSFWLGFSEHLSAGQLEPGITQYDEGPINPFSEEVNLEPKVELEEDPEEELDDGLVTCKIMTTVHVCALWSLFFIKYMLV